VERVLEVVGHEISPPSPGSVVFRPRRRRSTYRFRVVTFLARGGWVSCTRRRTSSCDERVALKTILSTTGQDERSVMMFKREVHLARQVTHPNVCRIFDVYRHRAGRGLSGEPPKALGHRLPRHGAPARRDPGRSSSAGGRLPTKDALVLARQMASASVPRTRPASCTAISRPKT
jgi:serine/threonine protein kinase